MPRLHRVEVIVLEDIEEGEERTVDPSASLLHQILVVFHWICLGDSIRYVTKVVLLLGLAVDAEGKDTILSQVHVGLPVVFLLKLRIQNHLEIAVLKQIRLIFL